ncbi:Propionyl-CoA carboxylase regulator [Hyphomicrobiales bacterium]|nr:Propionyl-CoA carboxylase regulator [Hyphomicrobiales bacterium]CAH1699606.1 Propionyl-CoA carboxylase regulator [Hyphomicrobiales bacterium]CAI0343958.1 Propionyl-CoA carboxylase regulator [Hyphomicrobiales bacterium]
MKRKVFAGPAVRRLREEAGWPQQLLARKIGISPSYLNQIERSQRPLSAAVLVELARVFRVDISQISNSDEDRLLVDLQDALSDPALAYPVLPSSELQAAIQQAPNVAKAVVRLQAAHRALEDKYQALDQTLSHSEAGDLAGAVAFPYDEVRDFFHRIGNYVDDLDRRAEETYAELGADTSALPDALIGRLELRHRLSVRIERSFGFDRPIRQFDRASRILRIDGCADASSRTFALAHQLALFEAQDVTAEVLTLASFRSESANAVCSVALANYFAGALILPYRKFLDSSRLHRHDLGILMHLFGASLEQVAHRLSTLQRPGARGIPFYFLRIDRAGNITKRHSATRLRFARYGGACPLWNVHQAFETPDRMLVQIAEMPDGTRYLSLAQAITKAGIGHSAARRRYAIGLGCELADAGQLVYADELDTENVKSIVHIGTSCRLCERPNCSQRAFPPAGASIRIDADIREAVPYRLVD